MTKPMIRIHNTETNEVIDREMNAAEYSEHQAMQAEEAKRESEAAVKAAEKASVLKRLGLTEDELKSILG
jgi:hypothetical protein